MSLLLLFIKSNCSLSEKAIFNTLQLLKEDCTIPFIARYRKERTGNLDEVQIGEIVQLKEQYQTLEKRKATILKAIKEQNLLTDVLQDQVLKTQSLIELEDLYLPYKKKRKTKAETARKKGFTV